MFTHIMEYYAAIKEGGLSLNDVMEQFPRHVAKGGYRTEWIVCYFLCRTGEIHMYTNVCICLYFQKEMIKECPKTNKNKGSKQS